MYTYEGMRIYSLQDALFIHDLVRNMPDYYWCYPDNTEKQITAYPSSEEIEDMYRKGVFLGKEKQSYNLLKKDQDMTMEELSIILNMNNPIMI